MTSDIANRDKQLQVEPRQLSSRVEPVAGVILAHQAISDHNNTRNHGGDTVYTGGFSARSNPPQVLVESTSLLSAKVVKFLGVKKIGSVCERFQVERSLQGDQVYVRGMHSALAALESHLQGLLNMDSQFEAYCRVFQECSPVGTIPRVPRMPPPGFAGNRISNQRANWTGAVEVNCKVFDFLKLKALHQLESEFKVAVKCNNLLPSSNVILTVSATTADSQVLEGLEKLKLLRESVMHDSIQIDKSAMPIVNQVKWEQLDTLVTFENNLCSVFGTREEVTAALSIIEEICLNWSASSDKDASKNKFLLRSGQVVVVKKANIVKEVVDVIVNAANKDLWHSGGVAKAICKAAGSQRFQEQSSALVRHNGCIQVGNAVVTAGFGSLNCKFVVHAVSPNWAEDERGQCEKLLKQLCLQCLHLTEKSGGKSVALPGLGSGHFGIPDLTCAKCLVAGVREYFSDNPKSCIRRVVFIDISDKIKGAFLSQCRKQYGNVTLLWSKSEDQQAADIETSV